MEGLRLFGQRLGFVDYSSGIQSGSDVEVGWVDLRIGRVRTAVINANEGLTKATKKNRACRWSRRVGSNSQSQATAPSP